MRKQARENAQRERAQEAPAQETKSGGRVFGCHTVCAIIFVIFVIVSLINSNSSKSTSQFSSRATTAANYSTSNSSRSKTGSDEAYFTRFGKKITSLTINTGRYVLGYSLPAGCSIQYDDNGVIKAERIRNDLYITGLKVGSSNVAIVNSKGAAVAICRINVQQGNGNTTGVVRTSTPTPKASSVKVYSLTLNIGKTQTITSLIPAGGYAYHKLTDIFTIRNTSNDIIIEGLKKGEATFEIYDSAETKIAECRVTVKPRSTTTVTRPTKTPVSNLNPVATPNPADVPYKTGGYTADELEEMGFRETVKADGTRSYPGFYQAPNGNYFPVN